MTDTTAMLASMALACIALTGCESTTAHEIAAAESYCRTHGGIQRIPAQISVGGRKLVVCNDDSEVTIIVEATP